MADSLHKGDKVEWSTSQGKTQGTVTRRVTKPTSEKGHKAQASAKEPQYEVRSDKTGAKAIHHPEALHRRRGA